jgi:hypothetical protein
MSLLSHIKRVEGLAYPASFRQMQDCSCWSELEAYCEGRATVFSWDNGYCIVTADEIVDLASAAPVSLAQLLRLCRQLRDHFGDTVVSLDARESTSWQLLCLAEVRGIVDILFADPWTWYGETFYSVELTFLR